MNYSFWAIQSVVFHPISFTHLIIEKWPMTPISWYMNKFAEVRDQRDQTHGNSSSPLRQLMISQKSKLRIGASYQFAPC